MREIKEQMPKTTKTKHKSCKSTFSSKDLKLRKILMWNGEKMGPNTQHELRNKSQSIQN